MTHRDCVCSTEVLIAVSCCPGASVLFIIIIRYFSVLPRAYSRPGGGQTNLFVPWLMFAEVTNSWNIWNDRNERETSLRWEAQLRVLLGTFFYLPWILVLQVTLVRNVDMMWAALTSRKQK